MADKMRLSVAVATTARTKALKDGAIASDLLELAFAEITPISDVRGAADYRFQLTRNILLKFFHETQAIPEMV